MEAVDYRGYEIRPKKVKGHVEYEVRGFGVYPTLEAATDAINRWLEEEENPNGQSNVQ